jgi:hypothetical protein
LLSGRASTAAYLDFGKKGKATLDIDCGVLILGANNQATALAANTKGVPPGMQPTAHQGRRHYETDIESVVLHRRFSHRDARGLQHLHLALKDEPAEWRNIAG